MAILITFLMIFVVRVFSNPIPEWEEYKIRYNVSYEGPENNYRMRIFYNNMHRINEHNRLYASGNVSFQLGMNKFGAYLDHEILLMASKHENRLADIPEGCHLRPPATKPITDLPKSVDWRLVDNVVRPVKDQGGCNSAYAFAAIGVLEGYLSRNESSKYKSANLSAQSVIDCSEKNGNLGCKAGNPYFAIEYLKASKAIDREESYPYTGKVGKECHFNLTGDAIPISGTVRCVKPRDETSIQTYVTKGPVSVTVDASSWEFRFYKSGIYKDKKCCSAAECVNHAMLLVGYDDTKSSESYWTVKNSWGESWGEAGYMRMSKDANSYKNHCGIATSAFFYEKT